MDPGLRRDDGGSKILVHRADLADPALRAAMAI
jgi:hypothetical protein